MFQTFDTPSRPEDGPPRLALLRTAMADAGVDAFLIPRSDAHRGENVAPCDERLAWLTGFTGSAGMAVATAERAAVFVDGRYTLQVQAQVDGGAFEYANIPKDELADWLNGALPEGGRVGFDPWLHSGGEVKRLAGKLSAELVPVDNLVDAVWADRPAAPRAPVVAHPLEYAGEAAAEKRARIGAAVREAGAEACVLTMPEAICWLLNIRGSDIERVPVVLAFAVIFVDGRVHLALPDPDVSEEVLAHLGDVSIGAKADFLAYLEGLEGKIGYDPASAPVALRDALAAPVEMRDPCAVPKAVKSPAEIAGARAAQARDAAAMVEFLAWLDRTAPEGGLTEIDVVRALEGYRRGTNALRDISFETICGAGPNGAIVHYRVSEGTDRAVAPGSLLLVDSGGQYLDGTTDITRTVAVGPVLEDAVRPFTLVLKGMIALSLMRWPVGLAGRDIEAAARMPLWAAGLDYDHGTGHGVGAYLSVHEGPASLSRRSGEPILAGMILSNEPGYYREGAFGIRIENLVLVEEATVPEGGERAMHSFETLTHVPIDRRLIDPRLLTEAERGWLNTYHAEVRSRLEGSVSSEAANWLATATKAI